ncbi:MAG: hypothetical protein CMJ46_12390 [Planctomyces sp.]|nr:hypothetical protein [Planctomyces sp.]
MNTETADTRPRWKRWLYPDYSNHSTKMLRKTKMLPQPGDQFTSTESLVRRTRVAAWAALITSLMPFVWIMISLQIFPQVISSDENFERFSSVFLVGMAIVLTSRTIAWVWFVWVLIEWVQHFVRNAFLLDPGLNRRKMYWFSFGLFGFPIGALLAPMVFGSLYRLSLPQNSEERQQRLLATPVGWRSVLLSSASILLGVVWIGEYIARYLKFDYGADTTTQLATIGACLSLVAMPCWANLIVILSRTQDQKYAEILTQPHSTCDQCGEPRLSVEGGCPVCGSGDGKIVKSK